MTTKPEGSRGSRPARIASLLAVALLGSVLASACGGGDDEAASAARRAKQEQAKKAEKAAATAPVKSAGTSDPRLATAVADSKTTAPIDLQYDLPVKPDVGQPFTVELSVEPRLPADALDVEIGESPGISVPGERVARFLMVEAATPYKFRFQARGDAPGLYYITVMATLSTNAQNETRAFSVPVVIGTPPAQEKPAPRRDATGAAIEPMPAREQ